MARYRRAGIKPEHLRNPDDAAKYRAYLAAQTLR
jgi:hypothetical protein